MRRFVFFSLATMLVVASLAVPTTSFAQAPAPVPITGAAAAVHPPPRSVQLDVKPPTEPFTDVPTALAGIPPKDQVNRFRCRTSGNPAAAVDISCDDSQLGQSHSPDNELAVAVNPHLPDHIVAGSNDYFYQYRGVERESLVPTGFFTSFDGGATWLDGQIPLGPADGAGDPSPAFVGALSSPTNPRESVVLMAGLSTREEGDEGDVTVSRSADGGQTWSEPNVVFRGIGADPEVVFFDKEWLTVDNSPSSPHYGRAYMTATRFISDEATLASEESAIFLSYSDDGGRTWSAPVEISGSHPSCTFQTTGAPGECDEDQFSIPETAPDGTLYVHFLNFQNSAAWEVPLDFDSQIMVLRSDDGGVTFGLPVPAVQLEDGSSDMPFSVILRQTIWGHQLRWTPAGTITVDPTDGEIVIVFSDRGRPNPNATPECVLVTPAPPIYDPCRAGPGMDTDVFSVRSTDGGATWSPRQVLDRAGGRPQWFPWADHRPDGTLAVAWDEDSSPAPADQFHHVLSVGGRRTVLSALGPEQIDISLTHWPGQLGGPETWPRICGPARYSDPPVTDARGKDCNYFHGDYTGLAVDRLGRIHVVWTGLNEFAVSPQLDPYTGGRHDGYRQDAMYARR